MNASVNALKQLSKRIRVNLVYDPLRKSTQEHKEPETIKP